MYTTSFWTYAYSKRQWQDSHKWLTLRKLPFVTDDLWNLLVTEEHTPIFSFLTVHPTMEMALYITWTWPSAQAKHMVIKQKFNVTWQRRLNSVKKGLKLNKFPHSASCLAETCLYNVITSQCHRFQRAFQNAVLPTFSYIVICKIYSQRLWSTNLSLSCYYIDLLWNWQQRQYDWNPSMNKIFHESTQNPNSDDKNWFIADDSSYYNSLV